jgi:hypothetical protein
MGEQFNPNALKFVKGQEGRVEDVEKAQAMAAEEEFYRNTAAQYERYCANPDDKEFQKPGAFSIVLGEYGDLQANKVTPEYIKKVGEIQAEKVGELFDYEQSVASKSDSELKGELAKLKLQEVIARANMALHNDPVLLVGNPNEANRSIAFDLIWEKKGMVQGELARREHAAKAPSN